MLGLVIRKQNRNGKKIIKIKQTIIFFFFCHQNCHDRKPSKKGKFPWISYNGESLADTQFCIEFLNKSKQVDLNSWLSPEQKAVALAFQRMVEDDLYW